MSEEKNKKLHWIFKTIILIAAWFLICILLVILKMTQGINISPQTVGVIPFGLIMSLAFVIQKIIIKKIENKLNTHHQVAVPHIDIAKSKLFPQEQVKLNRKSQHHKNS